MHTSRTTYQPLTPQMMVQLAAPHTWAASILPVLLAVVLTYAQSGITAEHYPMILILLAISVLMQSAVNTINDYFDYVKGTDTVENQADPTDAVLVYNNVNPEQVKHYAIGLVVAAFLLGIYCVIKAGFIPLVIAGIGAAVIFLYSGGKTPLSYLPLGEVVSGATMGGLITLASYYCLTLQFSWKVLLFSLPVIIGIALIMLTNNGCDIEKDTEAQRRTLPVLLGHDKTVTLYHVLIYVWVALICIIVVVYFRTGWIGLPFMLLAVHPLGRALLANPLTSESRAAAFAQCTSLNIALGAFYALCIALSA